MNSILSCYKRLIHMSLMFQAIQKNPNKYYNYAFEVLKILGVPETRQRNIDYKKTMELILYTIKILESDFILTNEKIKVLY